VIGISFGNTTSAIAYTNREGKAECIANEEGNRAIPSALAYVGGDEYHGDQAYAQLVRNPTNTILAFRDFIGKPFAKVDPTPCHLSAHPIEKDGFAAFSVSHVVDGQPAKAEVLTVSQVAARHLSKVRDSAADFLGKQIAGAVVTVPTDFSPEQRAALEQIGKDAKLPILQLIHEPVSVVQAYAALDLASGKESQDRTIVVADVGATRSDVSVISCRGGLYTLLATAHDESLGGRLLDDVLVEHFRKEFLKKHKVDIAGNTRALAKMRQQCETTKKTLSASSTATVSVESLADGLDFHSNINRIRYETLGRPVFSQVADLVLAAIKKANLETFDVAEVILAGGTTNTPKLAHNIAELFPESSDIRSPATSNTSLNPAELACLGAAVQASLIADYEQEDVQENTHPVITTVPHLAAAVGVKTADGFVTVLEQYTPLPSRRTVTVPFAKSLEICEGKAGIKEVEIEE
ncbi:heat shock protein 70 family, partial [Protomyces lactucae-debilis]